MLSAELWITPTEDMHVLPFRYHKGQREVQGQANSIACADKLSTWVGPVANYANEADLIVLASSRADTLAVAALSGPAPLVTAREVSNESDSGIVVQLPTRLSSILSTDTPWGGIVINPVTARRSRIAGRPKQRDESVEIACEIAFTNCRKYMTPTRSVGDAVHVGAIAAAPLALNDPWVSDTIAAGETAFLVTITPSGFADVSHRGGPPGFLRYDATERCIHWTEYLGDGMFVSTGNLRVNAQFALIVLDFATGDALRLDGDAEYTNVRRDRHERVDALLQASEPFPVQGHLEGRVHGAQRLSGFTLPRERVERHSRITSTDSTSVQHPQ